MSGWTLAIDFGTSFTTAATRDATGIHTVEFGTGRLLPSVVCVGDSGELLTGRAAEQLAAQVPGRAERLPKRALVSQSHVRLGTSNLPTTDLVAAVLSAAATAAIEHQGGTAPRGTVLTHPAAWGDRELGLLTKAAAGAGLAAPVLIPEPVAAACHYAHDQDVAQGALVAVYDLGGGTFDTAVVRREGDGFVVCGRPGGDPFLGGEDFDEQLLELLGTHAADRDPAGWDEFWAGTDRASSRQQTLLRRDVTQAKEALSATPTVYLGVPGYDEEFLLRRSQYEAAIELLLTTSLDLLVETIRSAGEVDAIVLAGGASRTPRISDLIGTRFGVSPRLFPDPKSVVARGALLTLTAEKKPPEPTKNFRSAPRHFRPDRDLFDE